MKKRSDMVHPRTDTVAMFSDSSDNVPEHKPIRLSFVLTAGVLAILLVGWSISATDLITRGRLEDLPVADKEILAEIDRSGVRISGARNNSFGQPAYIVPKVSWNRDIAAYAITRIELHHDSYAEVLSAFGKLNSLKEIAAPRLSKRERAALQSELPHVNVVEW